MDRNGGTRIGEEKDSYTKEGHKKEQRTGTGTGMRSRTRRVEDGQRLMGQTGKNMEMDRRTDTKEQEQGKCDTERGRDRTGKARDRLTGTEGQGQIQGKGYQKV